MSFFSRLRELVGSGAGSRRGIAGFRPTPGPFDIPPPDDVELDESELPWELRDDQPHDQPRPFPRRDMPREP
jgi:hypothetical protein